MKPCIKPFSPKGPPASRSRGGVILLSVAYGIAVNREGRSNARHRSDSTRMKNPPTAYWPPEAISTSRPGTAIFPFRFAAHPAP